MTGFNTHACPSFNMWGFFPGPELRCSVPCATPSHLSVSASRELSTSHSFYLTASQIARHVVELTGIFHPEIPRQTGRLHLLEGKVSPKSERWRVRGALKREGCYDSLVHCTMDFC